MSELATHVARRFPAVLQHDCPKCHAEAGQFCITKTNRIASVIHAPRYDQLCQDRFMGLRLKNDGEDKRMLCAKLHDHRGQHTNATRDLRWSKGFEAYEYEAESA